MRKEEGGGRREEEEEEEGGGIYSYKCGRHTAISCKRSTKLQMHLFLTVWYETPEVFTNIFLLLGPAQLAVHALGDLRPGNEARRTHIKQQLNLN